MSRTRIPRSLRALVAEDERHRCADCRSAVSIVGMPFEIDHVIPESLGGLTVRENLCLCCSPCNERKASCATAIDPLTGKRAALFHPRRQVWSQHFRWIDEGLGVFSRHRQPPRRRVGHLYVDRDVAFPPATGLLRSRMGRRSANTRVLNSIRERAPSCERLAAVSL